MYGRRRSQSRLVTFTYGGVALTILLLVAVLALVVAPPAPPSIAEFAPHAVDNIEEAPENQSSQFGAGAGACAEGQTCETTTTTEPDDAGTGGGPDNKKNKRIDVARVRRCVGDPPRQTEDPQSPPCVNYFEGDNGGATARGVTRDEIRIAVPSNQRAQLEAFLLHFNTRYELYGRTLRLIGVRPPGINAGTSAATAVAADEVGAFALVSPYYLGGNAWDSDDGLTKEASRRGILTVGTGASDHHHRHYAEFGPLAWAVRPPADVLQRSLATFVCSSLAGGKAKFAGAPTNLQTREFGILYVKQEQGPSLSVTPLRESLERCDVKAKVHEVAGDADDTEGIERVRTSGVTSALMVASARATSETMIAASKTGYQPEWITSGVGAEMESLWFPVPSEQKAHLFGLAPFNKILPPSHEPASWALQEGNPDRQVAKHRSLSVHQYEALRLLVSGLQLAGPRLTPESFARGLRDARFPNPASGHAPYFQAGIGFDAGDFTMLDDIGVMWWSETAPSYRSQFSDAGGWCYVGRGARYDLASIPNVEGQLFNPDPGACR